MMGTYVIKSSVGMLKAVFSETGLRSLSLVHEEISEDFSGLYDQDGGNELAALKTYINDYFYGREPGRGDIPLDMTTMMIVPMLLGLAVDDTIHFITHCKLEFQRSGNYRRSIEATFHTVGKAIFMTSFILVATFFVYVTSIANFFFHIGILAIAGVLSALLADYFITPILVYWSKPFGEEPEEE